MLALLATPGFPGFLGVGRLAGVAARCLPGTRPHLFLFCRSFTSLYCGVATSPNDAAAVAGTAMRVVCVAVVTLSLQGRLLLGSPKDPWS